MSKLSRVLKDFPRVFWVSNIMEVFERWAWYGFYNAFALYLTLSKESGALGFTQVQKGAIIGTGSMLLYFLPIITGAIADRIGYKKVLILSYTAYIAGFFMVGTFESYPLVFSAYIFLAIAGALFKPVISGMIAKTTNDKNASVGFGIFYMMVNIGGFIGPFIAGFLYKIDWNLVFLMSIIVIAINYIFVFFFFREPNREKSDESFIRNVGIAFKNILTTLSNWKYVMFLLIMGIFWAAFNQLYYSFPIFLDQWVDMDAISRALGLADGTITAPTVTSINAFYIIVLQMFVSSVSARYRPLQSMMTGILILALGLMGMFLTMNPWVMLIGALIFAIGEMASSPKFNEYVGRIAPPDKKALYMGTVFLAIAIGHFLAGWLSGKPFELLADKYHLLSKAVADKGFDMPAISEQFTQTQYLERAQELFGMNNQELTSYLWDNYHPSNVWILFSGVALAASILLLLYDKFILKGQSNTVK
ncbi:MAG: MFS transporter [Marinilabiliaceae bacterium]|jgi:dipeptide/tripeptide permease|nr:MFS transporter [Marinilabiliaceae bacterium]